MEITNEMIKAAVETFMFLAVELTILFLLISYLVSILQHYIPPEKIQAWLSGKSGGSYFLAALLGAITPFCSCSTIPFLKGLIRARAGFGTMLVFLFASPLLNPIIIGLFVVTFGYQIALSYFAVAMGVSVIAGYVLEKFGFSKYLQSAVYDAVPQNGCSASCKPKPKVNHWRKGWENSWQDFKQVLPYLFGGILLGSIIYGFMPSDFVATYASDDNPFAIPISAIIGVPLYIRAEAVIPLTSVLITKGMSLGAVMALIIGSAGASLTEVILLKSIFKTQMIIAFLLVIFSMAIICGYLFQAIF